MKTLAQKRGISVEHDIPETVRSSEMEQEMVSVRHGGKVDVHPEGQVEEQTAAKD